MIGLTVVLSATSCGISDVFDPPTITAPASEPAGASRVPAVTLDQRQLASILLTAEELPTGYHVMPDPTGAGAQLGSITDLGAGVQGCGQPASAPARGGDPSSAARAPQAKVTYQKSPTGPFVVEVAASVGDEQARAAVRALVEAPEQCPNFSGGKDVVGSDVTVSLSQLTVPRLGDASAGAQLAAAAANLPFQVRGAIIGVAHRGIALTVVVMSLGELDKREAETIARAAVAKVQARY